MLDEKNVARWLASAFYDHRFAILYGALDIAILYPSASRPDLRGLVMLLASLFIPSQVCLIAIWSSLASIPASRRIGRAAFWGGSLYFCLLGAAAVDPGDVGREFPLFVAIGMIALFSGTTAVSVVLRRNGLRLVKSPAELADLLDAPPSPYQIHLAELLGWITTVCIFLALDVAMIPQFWSSYAAHSYEPSQEEILIGSLCVAVIAAATGVAATGIFWLVLGVSEFGPAIRITLRDPLTCLVVWCILIVTCAAVIAGGSAGAAIMVMVLVAVAGFAGPLAANALILRGLGFRLACIPPPLAK